MSDGTIRRLLGYVRRYADADAGPASDAGLLSRYVATRDDAAFELLVWRHAGLVFGVCRRVLGDSHAAEDAFQATFLALARKAGAIRRGESLGGWLHRVARRIASRARTSTARRTVVERRAAIGIAVTADQCGLGDVRAVVDEEVDRLPERLRGAVVLCYLEGLDDGRGGAAHRLPARHGAVAAGRGARTAPWPADAARPRIAGGGSGGSLRSDDGPGGSDRAGGAGESGVCGGNGRGGRGGPASNRLGGRSNTSHDADQTQIRRRRRPRRWHARRRRGVDRGPRRRPGVALAEAPRPGERPAEPQADPRRPTDQEGQRINEEERERAEIERQRAEALRRDRLDETEKQIRRQEREIHEVEGNSLRSAIESRLRFMAAEDRLKQLGRLHDDRLPILAQQLSDLIAREKVLSVTLSREHPDMVSIRQQIELARETIKNLEPGRLSYEKEVAKARREMVEAEIDYRLREQEGNLAWARSQKRLEVLDEQWRSLSRPRGEPRGASPDLERKLDELIREVRELRREMKK